MRVKFSPSARTMDKVVSGIGTGVSATTAVLPCLYHSTEAPLLSPEEQAGEAWDTPKT